MGKWYYSVGGKAEGPVDDDFLIEGLTSGRLTLVDLVFQEGEVAWCTLGEIPKFREAFRAPPAPVITKDLEQYFTWVVLSRDLEGKFEQKGPFSADHIQAGLASGDFEYSDYAWKPGYKRWVRLGNLPEFDRRRRDRDFDPVNQLVPLPESLTSVPTVSPEQAVDNVERLKRPDPVDLSGVDEAPPAEAEGVDLVSTFGDAPTQISVPSSFEVPDALGSSDDAESDLSEGDVDDSSEDEVRDLSDGPDDDGFRQGATLEEKPKVSIDKSLTGREPGGDVKFAPPTSEPTSKESVRPQSGSRRRAIRFILIGAIVGITILILLKFYGRRWVEQWYEWRSHGRHSAQGEIQKPLSQEFQNRPTEAPAVPPDPNLVKPDEIPSEMESKVTDPQGAAAGNPNEKRSDLVNESSPSVRESLLKNVKVINPGTGAATALEVAEVRLNGELALLAFPSNAVIGETFGVHLKAGVGDILRKASYDKTFTLKRKSEEAPFLDLRKLALPQGAYRVEASIGGLKQQHRFFNGQRNEEFRSELRDHLKNLSQQLQFEKKALYYSALKFEGLANDLDEQYPKLKDHVGRWSQFYSRWKKEMHRARGPLMTLSLKYGSSQRAYTEEYSALKKIENDLLGQGKLLHTAVQQRRAVAGDKSQTLVKEIRQLKEEIATLTTTGS